jgi:ABC-2 type transport system permease protein
MKQFGKILKFELMGYLKNKIFVGITLFLVIAISVVMFIPNIITAFSNDTDIPSSSERPVMLVKSSNDELAEYTHTAFSAAFTDYEVKLSGDTLDVIQNEVKSGNAECAFVMESVTKYTYYVENLSLYDMNEDIAKSVLTDIYRVNLMIQLGLTPEQASAVMNVGIESNTVTLGKNQADNFFYTYIMIFALYMVILLYGQMVATNVATEKSSRAMELLVTSARPTSMMFGKVIASCLAGFAQLLAVFGTAILCFNINKGEWANIPMIASIFDMPIWLLGYMLVFFVLGFLIYAFLFGAIGSTASKLEDINTSSLPLTFLFIIAFIVVMFSMGSGTVDNTAMLVCSYVPFTSPMAMFTRIAMSTVAWYEILISVSILVASVIGIGVVSAKIYRAGVLMYGTPPKFTAIIKAVWKA